MPCGLRKVARRDWSPSTGKGAGLPRRSPRSGAAAHRQCLGQVATEEKSNEITAIAQLVKQIELNDTIITIDALGCQKDIAPEIVGSGGDFVIAVRDNQPKLREAIWKHRENWAKTRLFKQSLVLGLIFPTYWLINAHADF